MTREQRWIRGEMRPLEKHDDDASLSESQRRHYSARLATLRRILKIVEEAQA